MSPQALPRTARRPRTLPTVPEVVEAGGGVMGEGGGGGSGPKSVRGRPQQLRHVKSYVYMCMYAHMCVHSREHILKCEITFLPFTS